MRGSWPRLGSPALALLHVQLLLLLLLHLLVGTEAAFRNGTASRRSGGFRRSSATCAKRMLPEILPLPETCPPEVLGLGGTVYILYDVNISEGFNLRRDVYIRMAVFVRRLRRRQRFRNVRLVLPPWPRLYHWHSQGLQQAGLPWSHFFDLASLRRYAPVLDYEEFLAEQRLFGNPGAPLVHVTHAFRLQHYEVMLEQGIFRDKFERITDKPCSEGSLSGGPLLQQPELRVGRFHCVRFQGSAGLLEQLLRGAIDEDTAGPEDADDMRTYALLSAETVLHDHWGDEHFWRARRSMRFARHLDQVADDFRQHALATTAVSAGVQRPAMWELERPKRNARGGDYLCAHLRRGDFVRSREATTPSLKAAAQQLKQLMRAFNLTTVFLASDATPYELMELKELFYRFRFVHFAPESNVQRRELKDGGVAVVDQLVCAYARYFVGTYESTFTYRIYEEREILGFSQATTFNTFCKALGGSCSRNAVWPIVWDGDFDGDSEEDTDSDPY
ncbi:GDP-fucose protein O-fucosyltransferase 2 [Drosophila subpulchrella]|uniref:GDP-fucose protein O-fucosyltransferase 2 n=1 Tax=Drosophila subpulchrella TaxID=1486046 RepID=UPI0018A143EE|nr:GDP-fucose protein O-fucosyltransferase 2 [Drosophila subpulchrella]